MAEVGNLPLEGEPPQCKKSRVQPEFSTSLWNSIEIHPVVSDIDADNTGPLDSQINGTPVLTSNPENPDPSAVLPASDSGVGDEAMLSNPDSPNRSEVVDSIDM